LADYSNKRLFGVALEGIAVDDLPSWLTADSQFVSLSKAAENRKFVVELENLGRFGSWIIIEGDKDGKERICTGHARRNAEGRISS